MVVWFLVNQPMFRILWQKIGYPKKKDNGYYRHVLRTTMDTTGMC